MASRERSPSTWKSLLLLAVLTLAVATEGRCARIGKARNGGGSWKYLWESKLSRGPVPPSGPSKCHHKLSPFRGSSASSTAGYVNCP
ncbi:hypothetical protein ACJRO7_012135 [Eucalyptus globulus]|uniref:Uncharacterized protein n=1 Tax=Eucalyptus globulus TaxID=34317 RepID=A0ABD3LHI1_EUCGL